ncbi:Lrp/AsnC family transcriptional regulator [Nocardioides sp. NPDC059952]|uniref:Lrp/AsnC family transcriptional regulator n=1 Tax=Nocardioides sp. NPDC059952 TaxID=3347014 RepID=UPI003658EE19
MVTLDRIDKMLLTTLATDGRATYAELAHQVHLSANSVAERVRRLRREGVIQHFGVTLDPVALGKPLGVLSDIKLREGVERVAFAESLTAVPQVIGALRLTGENDYQLHIVAADTAELETVIDRLKRDFGVAAVNSRLILREVPVDVTQVLGS